MNAAQTLLRKQFPEIAGLQAICLARYLQFETVSSQSSLVPLSEIPKTLRSTHIASEIGTPGRRTLEIWGSPGPISLAIWVPGVPKTRAHRKSIRTRINSFAKQNE